MNSQMIKQNELERALAKEARLEDLLRALGSAVVAYSGGVDSAYLAFVTRRALAERMLAITAVSASLSTYQKEKAESFVKRFSIPHLFVESHEFENDRYVANNSDRCYFCKSELFRILKRVADEKGFARIVYGINQDDTGDFRPGHRAAVESEVGGPLLEVGLTKMEIRALSAHHGLPTSEDPASPCLSSRVPFTERIDLTKIRQIERGEDFLRGLGLSEMRVRHHGDVARIEVPTHELQRIVAPEVRARISAALHDIGFKWVTIDIDGFRSGSLTADYKK